MSKNVEKILEGYATGKDIEPDDREKGARPSQAELSRLYLEEKCTPGILANRYNVSCPTIRKWLKEYQIPIRNISEARLLKFGGQKPSGEKLRKLYLEDKKTTVEIAKIFGVKDPTIGLWLKEVGIEPNDRRGIYDEKGTRLETFQELIKFSGKKPKEISTSDFHEVKRIDGSAFSGLLGWYKRNNGVEHGEARDLLLEDLCGLELGVSVHSSRSKRISLEYLEKWDNYQGELEKLWGEHPELNREFPSSNWFKGNGFSYLIRGARLHGGLFEVRKRLGQDLMRSPNGHWRDFENIKREIIRIIGETPELEGEVPSSNWLADNGYNNLVNGIVRYHGGFRKIRKKISLEIKKTKYGK
jgi:transposase-like protein